MRNRTGAVATQRLFFALWPEASLQQQLATAAAALLARTTGRRVRPENLHCTLVFLGGVDAGQRLCVEAAADALALPAFDLTFDRFGYFRRPQVAWLGCTRTPPALLDLVGQLGRGCAACGFPPEQRPYEVHLTVARKLRRDPGRAELLWVGRGAVLVIALLAYVLALNPENKVLDLVAWAWAGFGAAFGPAIVLSLYWPRMTRNGALAGMLVGGLTVILWKQGSGGIFALYEMVPGVVLSALAIWIVSSLDRK